MIGQLTGTVAAVDSTTAVVDVNGIGFAVRMPNADLATLHIGNAAVVHTEMMVSQDAITLYGFLSTESKRMFLQLLKVNGIGPKVALSLPSTLPSRQLAQAIHDEDATALAKAPGLGKKGAQKIILELKGSIDFAAVAPAEPASTPCSCNCSRSTASAPKWRSRCFPRSRRVNWPRRSTTRTPRHWPRTRAGAKKERRKSSSRSRGRSI